MKRVVVIFQDNNTNTPQEDGYVFQDNNNQIFQDGNNYIFQ